MLFSRSSGERVRTGTFFLTVFAFAVFTAGFFVGFVAPEPLFVVLLVVFFVAVPLFVVVFLPAVEVFLLADFFIGFSGSVFFEGIVIKQS